MYIYISFMQLSQQPSSIIIGADSNVSKILPARRQDGLVPYKKPLSVRPYEYVPAQVQTIVPNNRKRSITEVDSANLPREKPLTNPLVNPLTNPLTNTHSTSLPRDITDLTKRPQIIKHIPHIRDKKMYSVLNIPPYIKKNQSELLPPSSVPPSASSLLPAPPSKEPYPIEPYPKKSKKRSSFTALPPPSPLFSVPHLSPQTSREYSSKDHSSKEHSKDHSFKAHSKNHSSTEHSKDHSSKEHSKDHSCKEHSKYHSSREHSKEFKETSSTSYSFNEKRKIDKIILIPVSHKYTSINPNKSTKDLPHIDKDFPPYRDVSPLEKDFLPHRDVPPLDKETPPQGDISPPEIIPKHLDEDLRALCSLTSSVSEYIKSICRRVFSIKAVWGSRHNLSAFLAAVDRYNP
jgi:hypothetical protein